MKDNLYYLSKIVGNIAQPATPLFIAIILGVYFYKKKKSLKWPFAFGIIYFSFITSPLVPIIANFYEKSEFTQLDNSPSDAVIVLGACNLSFDEINGQYQLGQHADRYIEGIRLFKQGKFKFFIASGGDLDNFDPHIKGEAVSLKKLAIEWGIPENQIIVENESFTTYQEAIKLKKIAKDYNLKNFTIVTSAFHMRRSALIFEHQGFMIKKYPVDQIFNADWSFSNIEVLRKITKEWLGLIGLWFYER